MTREDLLTVDRRIQASISFYNPGRVRFIAQYCDNEEERDALYALAAMLERISERATDNNADLLHYIKHGK